MWSFHPVVTSPYDAAELGHSQGRIGEFTKFSQPRPHMLANGRRRVHHQIQRA
jgi:hypothetical protein